MERAFTFECEGASLVGILHRPDRPRRRGVLIVVGGGPQYRVGGHRQLVLWARRLEAAGFPVMRFDHRGMGDSYGEFRGYRFIDADIRAAVDRFTEEVPEVDEVVLWGECDASSAILFYAHSDPRIKGAVLLNPWVSTESGKARTLLRHYYVTRLLRPQFWKKVVSGKFNPFASLRSLASSVRQAAGGSSVRQAATGNEGEGSSAGGTSLPDRMLSGLKRFHGPMMLVVSGRDLIARQFDDLVQASPEWQRELERLPTTRHDVPDSDHTFSSEKQRNEVVELGLSWLGTW